jgi:hypothetical protein
MLIRKIGEILSLIFHEDLNQVFIFGKENKGYMGA